MVELATRRAPPTPTAAWLKTLPPATRYAFHGDSVARAAAAPIWGTGFSAEACRATVGAARAALWLGPDEYLLLDMGSAAAAEGQAPSGDPFDALETALRGIPHALVDISHRQLGLEVSGPQAATILNGACPLDLDLGEFPVGMCTRTVLAKADVVLWRTAKDAFHLEVWRSFAGYVTGILTEIAAGL